MFIGNKEKYNHFCNSLKALPFYFQPWWLDSICGENSWDVALSSDKGGNIVAALPYYFQNKWAMKIIRMPHLTPYLGVVFKYPQNLEKRQSTYAFEKKAIYDMISQLPGYAFLNIHCNPEIKNTLPFNWLGFEVHHMISYKLLFNKNIEHIWKNLSVNTRNEVNKAENIFTIKELNDLDKFYNLQQLTFAHHGNNVPFSRDLLNNLDGALLQRNKRKIFGAYNTEKELCAATYCVIDHGTIFTLMIGSDPNKRQGGAVQALIWYIISTMNEKHEMLDFCGSMIERIEKVFRAFGAEQTSYYKIRKLNGPVVKLSRAILGKPT